ncbi:ead/Ea22-like family protein [Escherichia coli]|uniref:ead/Ea22-like family protein n=1 Tax=Escherichia coli TaxID=562 RepID=UPI000BEA4884|nr:ead/Ea22-like family protein [Escherichia coli]EEZ5746734.1 ead/Ea22-like family protein [Escherichia coli O25]EFA4410826.1 ead/Ea22-like family protein [Escherichia coli]EFC1798215.1 ead/Ea22-like family protein [Escherichia coli]EGC5562539.1 ead/Ea22-like family protein [Escherichia coli]EGF4701806.1 ead/Ea22-like family protein [Escherichia coli]
MSEINYQALREAAERAIPAMERLLMLPADDDLLSEQELKDFGVDIDALNAFKFLAGPETVLALLDERERNQQYIKRRDQENEDIALTVGKLLIENGQLVADTLRHLADNEIDSDYFAITSTNENGTEIDHEMAITDYALQAAGTVDELVAALESAEKRNAKLQSENAYIRNRFKELDLLIGKNILVMQAAIIEWQATGDAKSGLAWIYNTLFGPGELPDESEKDAQAYFNRKYAPIDEKLMELHKWFWEQSEAERAAGIRIKGD